MAKPESLRSQQRSFTRTRFLDAALEVFKEVGFHEATIDMITTRAGANRSTFYLHFKDKTSLALAAWQRISPSGQEAFALINEMEEPTFKSMRAWVDYMADTWVEHSELYSAIMQAQMTDSAITTRNYEIIREDMSPYINRFKGKRKTEAKRRVELFCMQFEMYFFTTICQYKEKPASDDLDLLAELSLYTLFQKTRA
ncbi:MAG: helix-turn-helix domain-containing protein [Pseudomonadota bacterium]